MKACDNNPTRDWCNWEIFICSCTWDNCDELGTGSNNFAVTCSSALTFDSETVRLFRIVLLW